MRDRPRPRPAPVVQEYRPAVYLTPLQYAVFELVAKGSTHAQAGTRLGITPHAVHNHMRRIARAIGVRTGTEAVTLARAGQVQVGQRQGKRAA
jgi:DNA-binding NarL/FixJ family response regulator